MRLEPLMYLNDKPKDHLPHVFMESTVINELFGLEVELEGSGGISIVINDLVKWWTFHNDGSLRKLKPGDEAIEYVTKKPLTLEEAEEAIDVLCKFLNAPGKNVYDSYRTSIHVHVNCMNDTYLHIYNFITLCIIFDELFVSQNGEHRVGNNFCLRAKDAQGQIVTLCDHITKFGHLFKLENNLRYSSVNFASLNKFGTVEFRSLECTTDVNRIKHWIRTINALKKASREFSNPQEIISKFSQVGTENFLITCLEEQAAKYINVPEHSQMMFEGMRLAQEFAFSSVNWTGYEKGEKKPKRSASPKGLALPPELDLGAPVPGAPDWVIPAEPAPAEPAPDWYDDDDDDIDEFFEEDDDF